MAGAPLTPLTATTNELESQTIQRQTVKEISALAATETLNIPDSKVPWKQLMILFFLRGSRPLTYGVVFAFVNQQLVQLGIADHNSAGAYSGIVESAMALTMLFGLLPCSYFAGYGRKPMVIIGTLGACTTAFFFGFQTSLTGLIAVRAIVGFFASSQSALMPMVEEMSTPETSARCYSVMALAWQTHAFVAPAIGGALSNPAVTFPRLFAGGLFERYPYALPCVVTATIPFIMAILGAFVLEETLPANLRRKGWPKLPWARRKVQNSKSETAPLLSQPVSKKSSYKVLFGRSQRYVIGFSSFLVFTMRYMSAFEILLLFSPPHLGGIGLSPASIGAYLGIRPLGIACFELFSFPYLKRKFGLAGIMHIFIWFYPITALSYVYLAYNARSGGTFPIGSLSLAVISCVFGNICFLCMDIQMERAPSRERLTDFSALCVATCQVGGVLGPLAAGFLYAATVSYNLLGGYLAHATFVGLTVLCGLIISQYEDLPTWKDREEEEQDRL